MGRNFLEKFLDFADRFLDRIPKEKRKPALIMFGAVIFLCICVTVIALISGGSSGSHITPQRTQIISGPEIPADELFYPSEPDFLPSLILERDPKNSWTASDLSLFWTDPLSGHENIWREFATETLDRLMEGVR